MPQYQARSTNGASYNNYDYVDPQRIPAANQLGAQYKATNSNSRPMIPSTKELPLPKYEERLPPPYKGRFPVLPNIKKLIRNGNTRPISDMYIVKANNKASRNNYRKQQTLVQCQTSQIHGKN